MLRLADKPGPSYRAPDRAYYSVAPGTLALRQWEANMSLDYGNLLSRAWQITWKHKVLWIFGILAGLGNGGGPPGDGGNNDGGRPSSGFEFGYPQFDQWINQIDQAALVAIVLGLICLALLIAVALIALQVIGRGGLIGGVLKADADQAVTFGETWQVGVSKFWTLFLIGLIPGLVSLLLAIIVIAPGVILSVLTLGLGFLCLIPLVCLLAIGGVILNIIAYFAQIAAVAENLGVLDALRRAWAVITANVGNIVVLGLIVLAVGFFAGLIRRSRTIRRSTRSAMAGWPSRWPAAPCIFRFCWCSAASCRPGSRLPGPWPTSA